MERHEIEESGILNGARAWLISDGKAGMIVQLRGVADALGLDYTFKEVQPTGLYKALAPWGPVAPSTRLGEEGSLFSPPWPEVVIATGRASIPYLRAIRRKAGPGTYTIVLQDPKSGENTADLIWVPEHDKRRGTNVITTPTAPHSFTPDRLDALRAEIPAAIVSLPRPRVAVVLGGKNSVYRFTEQDHQRLEESLRSLSDLGVSFLVTPSRRSHKRLIESAEAGTRRAPRIVWDGNGDNPYAHFLAAADAFVVTADSVNMCGEAAATGKPVYTFTPSGGSDKFRRFHEVLRKHGATRELPERFDSLGKWDYAPLDAAAGIAKEIEQRYARRKRMLSGIRS